MRILNVIFLGGVAVTGSLDAAEVSFGADAKMTGEFLEWDKEGGVSLRSPLSEKLLQLDSAKLSKVDFGFGERKVELPDHRIYLVNGDAIAARIEEMDEKVIRVTSPYLGELGIPREMVETVQLGIVPEKSVAVGIGRIENWTLGMGGDSNWKLRDEVMSSSGSGIVARKFEMPQKYIIKYDLRWSGQPNFWMYFGDPLKSSEERTDRYFLQFGIGGLYVKRELSDGNREAMIMMSNRRPDTYEGSKMSIEMRVDQITGRMQIYIDGNLQGKYRDDREVLPTGSGISFVSRAHTSTKHFVSNFEVLEWDDRGDRHRSEERGEDDEDSLIGRNGEGFGGRLESVKDGENGKVFRFKSDYKKEPIDLPESEVSTIFFEKQKDSKGYDSVEGMVVRTLGEGVLALESCEYGENGLAISHPFLGRIEVKKEILERMELRKVPKAK